MVKLYREVTAELKKVVWPKKEEIKKATALVVLLGMAAVLYLGIFDFIFEAFMELVKSVIKKG